MNETDIPAEKKPKGRSPHSWVWAAAFALLGAVFAFASAPGALAQVRDPSAPSTAQAENLQRNRMYAAILQQVFDFIQRNYVEEIDSTELFEGAMRGIFDSIDDPHSAFLPESEMRQLNDTTQGSFGGVGLLITQPTRAIGGRPPYVEVSSPIEGTPGWRAGINPGDLIIAIDGEPTDRLNMDEVLARLRGQPGTEVALTIRRGERLEFPVTLTRAIIEVPTAHHAMIGDDIGYLRLTSFTPMTASRAAEAIAEFAQSGYQGMILDLRNNSGGLLSAAIDVASLFLDGGVVVRTHSRIPSENQAFSTRRPPIVAQDIPLIVLVNRGSASASEIVAGALKDRRRALIVGETTFGKGSVQQVYPIGNVGFRLTTARYVTPNNAVIDGIGIPPDMVVSMPSFADADIEQLNRLINDGRIPEFVRANPDAGAAQIDVFARSIVAEYGLENALVMRLIRDERNRTVITPVYDLEDDVQLSAAVDILRGGNFQYLLQTARTLQALQEELLMGSEGESGAS
ncbi:MAG: S41 family peptidase [Treponema sp.]|nr:S41 family peptidase [Treponema sp.]